MPSFLLSPLHQIEYAVADLDYCQRFFKDVFGEHDVETEFSRELSNPALEIRHVGFGETVQQLCQPLMPHLPHHDAMQALGNCVHNLCFLVDSIDNIRANCAAAGIEALIEFPMDDIWGGALAPENIEGNLVACIMNSRAVLGYQLELAETPWVAEPEPPLMLPAFGPQWQATGVTSQNTLRGIIVVVRDLDETKTALETIFVDNLDLIAAPVELEEQNLKCMVVKLGLVPLVYVQPLSDEGTFGRFLAEKGPAVHSLVAATADNRISDESLAEFELSSETASMEFVEVLGVLLDDRPENVRCLMGLEKVGVDFLLI